MAGDGVSLPTSIAQMGSVAKTQAKTQQTAQPVTPFADQLDKKDELKVQRVKETLKTEQEKVDPDQEREKGKDKRRRRRMRRKGKNLGLNAEAPENGEDSPENEESAEKVGTVLDLRV